MNKKLSRRKKIVIYSFIFVIVLFDFFLGLLLYMGQGTSSVDNLIIFNNLCGYYRSIVMSHDLLDENDKKYFLRYIPNWDSFFTGEAKKFPYCWFDYDYITFAPYSINYIRKLMYKRQGAYLIFDLNTASKKVQNDPKTIIITEPYPQYGERRVLTVEGLNGNGPQRLSESEVQKQFKLQNWHPVVSFPTKGNKPPSECEDSCMRSRKLLSGFNKKMPLSNITNNPFRGP
jgi:hypothetical protein